MTTTDRAVADRLWQLRGAARRPLGVGHHRRRVGGVDGRARQPIDNVLPAIAGFIVRGVTP